MAYRFDISARNLTWPAACACCLGRSDSHLRSSVSVSKGKRVVRTTTRSWDIPYCSTCLTHYRTHAGASKWPILGAVAGLIAGGWLAMQAPQHQAQMAMGAIAFGALLGLSMIPYFAARSRARQQMGSACACPGSAVTYLGWYGSDQSFQFENKNYLDRFLDLNSRKRRTLINQV